MIGILFYTQFFFLLLRKISKQLYEHMDFS